MQGSITIATTFIVYLAAMLAIGIFAYYRTRSLSDYLLGGRKLSSFTTALSAGASDMSGWLMLGLPGYAYARGYEACWIALGLLAGTYIDWRFVAERLRIYTAAFGDSITLSAYFENRFNDRSRMLRVVTAFFILTFFLFYTSSGLVAGGKLFESVFGLPYAWAVLAGAFAIIVYTFLGGFTAVCWTDCVQGLMMSVALVLVPVIAIASQGGWGRAAEAMRSRDPAMLDPFGASGGWLSIVSLGDIPKNHDLAIELELPRVTVRASGHVKHAKTAAVGSDVIGRFGVAVTGVTGEVDRFSRYLRESAVVKFLAEYSTRYRTYLDKRLTKEPEHRERARRLPAHLPASISAGGKQSSLGAIRNVSDTGMLLVSRDKLEEGDRIAAEIVFRDGAAIRLSLSGDGDYRPGDRVRVEVDVADGDLLRRP